MSLDDRNAQLEQKLEHNPIDDQITALVKADRQKKWYLLALTLMGVALAYGWWGNHNLAIRAESNRSAIIRNCETSNESRAKNKQLWEYILAIPSTEEPTPERDKRIKDFRAFINDTFKERDCMAEIKENQ